MENATSTSLVDLDLRGYIRDLPDYPSAGITFRDITPLLVAQPCKFQQENRTYNFGPNLF